jgi:hypothetical protein
MVQPVIEEAPVPQVMFEEPDIFPRGLLEQVNQIVAVSFLEKTEHEAPVIFQMQKPAVEAILGTAPGGIRRFREPLPGSRLGSCFPRAYQDFHGSSFWGGLGLAGGFSGALGAGWPG